MQIEQEKANAEIATDRRGEESNGKQGEFGGANRTVLLTKKSMTRREARMLVSTRRSPQ